MDILEIAEERYYERLEEQEENSRNEQEESNCDICDRVSDIWEDVKDYLDEKF